VLSGVKVAAAVGGWEAHLYPQSAVLLGGRGDGCVVRVGDRLDDGQAEAGPVSLTAPVGGEPLEGLEEVVDVVC
jgi:hypothetical protein